MAKNLTRQGGCLKYEDTATGFIKYINLKDVRIEKISGNTVRISDGSVYDYTELTTPSVGSAEALADEIGTFKNEANGGTGAVDSVFGRTGVVTAQSGDYTAAQVTNALDTTTLGAGVETFLGTPTSANFRTAVTDETGTGSLVFATSPTLVTPILGTPTSGTLTNCTGLPVAGITSSTSTALGVGSLEVGHASDTTIARVSAGVISVEGVTVPTISSTSTLTNKRIDPRVTSTASASSITPSPATQDLYVITALATGLTINAPTGTPVQGQKLMFRIKDNGTSRTLTWNAIFRAIGVTIPTSTTVNKTTYIGCIYNSTDTKWDVIAVNTEA